MASIFAVLRVNDNNPELLADERSLTPTEEDMDIAIGLADMFIEHAFRLYEILPDANVGGRGERFINFNSKLPAEFKTGEAVNIGGELDIPERTVKDWLSKTDDFRKIKYGYYSKA